jgi:hypothetical protein
MCECYKIGGRFIAEDPDCPEHGTYAQEAERVRDASTGEEWFRALSDDQRSELVGHVPMTGRTFFECDLIDIINAAFEAGKHS